MSFLPSLAGGYPALSAVIAKIDEHLSRKHPDFFGSSPFHPHLAVKGAKVVHDSLWGTNLFTWRELALIDSPIIQRLRDIHQVGLGYQVYPSARHTRFEHCLGVVTTATRVFDALLQKNEGDFQTILTVLYDGIPTREAVAKLRQELRLAALLHDSGHSLFSHTSELVYSKLGLLREAVREIRSFTGKHNGAGEVISFCIASTPSVGRLLERAKANLITETRDARSDEYTGEIDLESVALLIVGRARHPYLQFLADIVSSGFDADKLDYLLRDARAAGLPLSYDIDRYLYAVQLEKDRLPDDEGELERLYRAVSEKPVTREPRGTQARYPYYDCYRLRLPRTAINAIEQIIICKMMLYGYLYHHPKVRAAEGLLLRLLSELVMRWQAEGMDDMGILCKFLDFTDSALWTGEISDCPVPHVREYGYRIRYRLLPREVYRFGGGTTTHAEGALLKDFLTDLQDPGQGGAVVSKLEMAIGEELVRLRPDLGKEWNGALAKAGVWLDVPSPPRFEDVGVLLGGDRGLGGVPIAQVFPITQWTDAYNAFRYYVRIFSFSEYMEPTRTAARLAMQRVIGIKGSRFYQEVRRWRS